MPGPARIRLARSLPDVPRWVETRSVLLSGRCEVFGDEEMGFVVRDPEDVWICAVGNPAEGAIVEAVARVHEEGDAVVFAPPESAPHVAAALPGWRSNGATLHLLGDDEKLPQVPASSVRLLASPELASIGGLPPDLASELRDAAERSPVAASLEDGRPVSFCYAAARTEGLWDVSIDTLQGFGRRGHASRCVAFMVALMEEEGLRPVWGAEDWNAASLGLAARLGFVSVDEMVMFRPAARGS